MTVTETLYRHTKTGQTATKQQWVESYQDAIENPDSRGLIVAIGGRSADQLFFDYVHKGWIYEVKK
jgi:hypothetical protein